MRLLHYVECEIISNGEKFSRLYRHVYAREFKAFRMSEIDPARSNSFRMFVFELR